MKLGINNKINQSPYLMAPSVASISMSEFFKSHETLLTVRDPRRQISADLKRAKEVLARIQEIVLA